MLHSLGGNSNSIIIIKKTFSRDYYSNGKERIKRGNSVKQEGKLAVNNPFKKKHLPPNVYESDHFTGETEIIKIKPALSNKERHVGVYKQG